MTLNITDAELHEWAMMRADDAGRLARELVACRLQSQAAIAAAYEAAARTIDTLGDSAVTEALGTRLCCDGRMCGCQGADVGAYILHHIRALATPDQIAALKTIRAADQAEITRLRAVIAKDAAQMIEDQHKMHKAVEALRESVLAIQYLDERAPSGTTPPTLAKITAVLAEIGGA